MHVLVNKIPNKALMKMFIKCLMWRVSWKLVLRG